MKRAVLFVLASALAPMIASAQLYKYVDKDGKTVYSDQPPANVESKRIQVQTAPAAPSAAAAAAPAPAKTALEKDKELEKGRKEGREAAKKAEATAKNEQQQAERCANARSNYEVYNSGTRLTEIVNGEKVFLDDAQIAAKKEQARAKMEEACKKG